MEFAQTRTMDERQTVASACAVGLRLDMPILIDTIENAADLAFNAWPERLFVLSVDGTVVYKGGKGPYGFAPEELEAFLSDYLD